MISVRLLVIFWVSMALVLTACYSQTFDPDVDDKEYLNNIERRLQRETMKAHAVLVNQTKLLREVTRTFIESKIKENLFKAVRARVEEELELLAKNNVSYRRARQEDNEEDDDGSTTPPPRPPGLLPQLASVVTTLFGADVNVTSYLKEATSFLPPDISYRIVTAASLIDPQRFTSTTTSTTPPPVVINGQVIPQAVLVNRSAYIDYQYGIVPPRTPGVSIRPDTLQLPPTPGTVLQNQGGVEPAVLQGVVQSVNKPQTSSFTAQRVQPQLQPQQTLASNVQPAQVPSLGSNLVAHASPVILGAQSALPPGSSAIIIQPELPLSSQPNGNVQHVLVPSIQIASNVQSPTSTGGNSEEDESAEGEITGPGPENEDSDELADDVEIARDAKKEPPKGYFLDEYPALGYALRFFNRLGSRSEIPTTTEYMNVTRKSIDSLEEEEARATAPSTSTFQTLVKSGIYIYEGAREAYTLLQHVNKFLDRVGDRLDSAGFGVDPSGSIDE